MRSPNKIVTSPFNKRSTSVDIFTNTRNEKQATKLFEEYHKVLDQGKSQDKNIFLLNVLEKLYLLDSEILKEPTAQEGHRRYINLKN